MFQRTVATGRFTLLLVGLCCVILWFCQPSSVALDSVLGLAACAVAVYLMTELVAGFALLRSGSSMPQATLAVLLLLCPSLREISLMHVVLGAALLNFFPLFATYGRRGWAVGGYLISLLLGIASIVCPPLAWLLPVVWVVCILLRSLDFRTFVASLMGVITPYLYIVAFRLDDIAVWAESWWTEAKPALPDYSALDGGTIAASAVTFLHFAVGCANFWIFSQLDKTRTRYLLYGTALIGACVFALLALFPEHIDALLPVCVVPAAIMSGHFSAQHFGRIQNIVFIVLAVLTIAALIGFTCGWIG